MTEDMCIMKNRIAALELAFKQLVATMCQPTYGPMLDEGETES